MFVIYSVISFALGKTPLSQLPIYQELDVRDVVSTGPLARGHLI